MASSASEPTRASFPNQFVLYFSATRPAFLLATVAACLLGFAAAVHSGIAISFSTAWLTLLLAVLVHAGVNVLNDYFDAINGTDALNTERLYPYTGGSRFIQNAILSPLQTRNFANLLLATAMLGGIYLAWQVGYGLLLIGAFGMLAGWAYSARPLKLNARGWGEFCVLTGFLGIVIGADFVQRKAFSYEPVIIGMPYALLATSLLYINQFPDRKADALAGKRTLVVRLPLALSIWGYLLLILSALFWISAAVQAAKLPPLALLSVLPLLFSLQAFWRLRQYVIKSAALLPAIKLTLASMLSHALLLTLIMLWNTP